MPAWGSVPGQSLACFGGLAKVNCRRRPVGKGAAVTAESRGGKEVRSLSDEAEWGRGKPESIRGLERGRQEEVDDANFSGRGESALRISLCRTAGSSFGEEVAGMAIRQQVSPQSDVHQEEEGEQSHPGCPAAVSIRAFHTLQRYPFCPRRSKRAKACSRAGEKFVRLRENH